MHKYDTSQTAKGYYIILEHAVVSQNLRISLNMRTVTYRCVRLWGRHDHQCKDPPEQLTQVDDSTPPYKTPTGGHAYINRRFFLPPTNRMSVMRHIYLNSVAFYKTSFLSQFCCVLSFRSYVLHG